jgi:hypothetical protein
MIMLALLLISAVRLHLVVPSQGEAGGGARTIRNEERRGPRTYGWRVLVGAGALAILVSGCHGAPDVHSGTAATAV